MTYTMPPVRSMAALDGVQFYPNVGSALDLSSYVNTAVPAGSKGRVIVVGDHFEETDDPGVAKYFVGNSIGFGGPDLDPALAASIVAKYRAKGINLVRLHGLENYLMVGGALNSAGTAITTTRAYSSLRWAEFDYFFSIAKTAGINFSLGIQSINLAVAVGNTTNRFVRSANNTGTITLTISGGVITAATCTGTSGHFYPPSIIVKGEGIGAVITCTIDGSGNVVSPMTVVNGGHDYVDGTNTTIGTFLGGTGYMKERIPGDTNVQGEFAQTTYDILNHVNPNTGLAYKDDPALIFVESYNEVSQQVQDNVNAELYPLFRNWLYPRYGSLTALNTKWGSTFTDWSQINPIGYGTTTSGLKALRWQKQDSIYWRAELDNTEYARYIAAARAAGYNGLVTGLDLIAGPFTSRQYALQGDFQNAHSYISLQDSYVAGQSLTSGAVNVNAPFHNTPTGVLGPFQYASDQKPIVHTEIGSSMPNKYRGESSTLFAALSSMHNGSAICLHSDSLIGLKWGGSVNPSRNKGMYPLAWEHDPATVASTFIAALIFHRGDVSTPSVDNTFTVNDRALSYHANLADTSDPYYDSTQFYPNVESAVGPFVGRTATRWDATNNSSTASAWQTKIKRTMSQVLIDSNMDTAHDTYDWVVTKGNTSLLNERPFKSVMYTKNREIFADTLSGVSGINTAKTQTAMIYQDFLDGAGTHVRVGDAITANTNRAIANVTGFAFRTNYRGTAFWQNLSINFIREGVFLAITSKNNVAITNETNIIVAMSGNSYNTGATWQAAGSTIQSVPITDNGGVNFSSPPDITFAGGTGNGAVAVGVLSSGATGTLSSIRIIKGGQNYVAGVTASITGQASVVLGTPVLTADSEQKEIKLLTNYSGGQEGWPIQATKQVVNFDIIGVSTAQPWCMYELGYDGTRGQQHPVTNTSTGINVIINTNLTTLTGVFFELVKGTRCRRSRN